MSRSRLVVWLGRALCAGWLLVAASPGWCAAPWGKPSDAENKIEKALGEPTQLEFIECPLQDAVNFLKDLHDIEIQIDRRALKESGTAADTPVTKNLKGISLDAALKLMLGELDLSYSITDEVLLITTPVEVGCRLYPRVYPVGHLIAGPDDPAAARREFAAVRSLITSVVLPQSWDEVGGPGTIVGIPPGAPKAAVVVQDRRSHEEVEELLALLDRAARLEPGAGPIPLMPTDPAEEKIRKALASPTEFEFIETPLQDVVELLKDKHKIEIQIDRRALDDVGIGTDTRVTKNLHGISLRSALRLMLREFDLTYVIQDEVLLVTTPEEACGRPSTVLYPIGDLMPVDCKEPKDRTAYGAKLVETVTRLIKPATWDEIGGPGSAAPLCTRGLDVLVVSQTLDVQREVAGLLARPELRQPVTGWPTGSEKESEPPANPGQSGFFSFE